MSSTLPERRLRRVLLRMTDLLEDIAAARTSDYLEVRLAVLVDVARFMNDFSEVSSLHPAPWERLQSYRNDPFRNYTPLTTASRQANEKFDDVCLTFLQAHPRVFDAYGRKETPTWSEVELNAILGLLSAAVTDGEVLLVRDIAGCGGSNYKVRNVELHVKTLFVPEHVQLQRSRRIKTTLYQEDMKRAYGGGARSNYRP